MEGKTIVECVDWEKDLSSYAAVCDNVNEIRGLEEVDSCKESEHDLVENLSAVWNGKNDSSKVTDYLYRPFSEGWRHW